MHKKSLVALACSGAFALASPSISADDSINISGFLTTGMTVSDSEVPYIYNKHFTDEPNFHADSVLGIQFDSKIDDNTRVSAQLIANFNGDNFDTNAEWLYVERSLSPRLRVRAGRLRLPLYAASQYVYVGSAYPWARPPAEVYTLMAGITRYSGLDAIWQSQFGDATLTIQPYVGNIKGEEIAFGPIDVELNTESLFGISTQLTFGGVKVQALISKIDAKIDTPAATINSNSTLATLTLEVEQGQFDLRTEWAIRETDSLGESWGWYGTVAYHHNQFTPYITLGLRDSKKEFQANNTVVRDSESAALGLRWDLGPKISLKSEMHYGKAKGDRTGLFTNYVADPDDSNKLDDDVLLASFTVNVLF